MRSIAEPAASAIELIESLVGDRIRRVAYRDIDYPDGAPHFVEADRHSLCRDAGHSRGEPWWD